MQKITFWLIALVIINSSYSQISHTDINDFTFNHNSWVFIDIDFNNDGTPEFTLDEQGDGVVGTFFDPNNVNFYGTGTFADGHGWDIMKALSNGDLIDNTGVFDAMGDAYVNAFWANPDEIFPEGDSYIGVRFKLGANTHYGWLRVNSTSSVITLLDYAYNETPNETITAGQTVLSIEDFNNGLQVSLYPNPTTDFINVQGQITVTKANLINLLGKTKAVKVTNNKIDVRNNTKGVYFLQVITNTNKTTTKKIIIH